MVEQTKTLVEVYTTPSCPHSQALKRKLEHDGTPFVEYNVQLDPGALQRMLALNGGRRNVPTVVQGETVTVGFHGA